MKIAIALNKYPDISGFMSRSECVFTHLSNSDKLDKKSTSPVVHKEVNKKSGKSF